jgi:hypothetical protein
MVIPFVVVSPNIVRFSSNAKRVPRLAGRAAFAAGPGRDVLPEAAARGSLPVEDGTQRAPGIHLGEDAHHAIARMLGSLTTPASSPPLDGIYFAAGLPSIGAAKRLNSLTVFATS